MSFPIILCGKSTETAKSVKKGLEPEVEVLHLVLSITDFNAWIPSLLSGNRPPLSDNIGTQNYSQHPVAIVCGAQYNEAMVLKMQQACRDIGVDDVPFLVADSSVSMPAVGPKYAKMMVSRVKNCLIELEEEGRLEGSGIWYY